MGRGCSLEDVMCIYIDILEENSRAEIILIYIIVEEEGGCEQSRGERTTDLDNSIYNM